ncbi:neutral/alkaline non-lysosomal ceramidase N-terminal domain-containing protein [Candidatus Poribacteria bacterium]
MDLKVGVSKHEMTPDRPAWLAGYAARNKPSEAVHDPLFVTAIVFDDGNARLAMVSADLCFVPTSVKERIAPKVEAEASMPPEHLIIAATHTHSGPVTSGDNLDAEWLESLGDKILMAINEAASSMVSAKISVGVGTCDVGTNRRERRTDGSITLGNNPDGARDRQVGVISICSESGTPVVTLINYGCHGTALGQENYIISADYMGAAVRQVQEEIEGVVTFFNGAPGNVDPYHHFTVDFDCVEELGEGLAVEVKRVLREKMVEAESTPIYVNPIEIGLPLRTPREEDGNPISVIGTSIIRIGDLQFVAFPGEMFAQTSNVLKARSSAKCPFVIGYLCGKSAGYLPVRWAYQSGGYEIKTTRHSPDAEEIYVNIVSRLISL